MMGSARWLSALPWAESLLFWAYRCLANDPNARTSRLKEYTVDFFD
jgi:hypothetical protein